MSVESELKRVSQEVSDLAQEVDGLGRQLTKLVGALEQDDHLRERAEAAEERERDDRHEEILKALKEIKDACKAMAAYARDLPERVVRHVERKIYELRVARFEAQQAGVQNEPALLPPVPMPPAREPTAKVIAQIEGKDESAALTPAQQRGLAKLIKKAWDYKFHVGGGIVGAHWLWERAAAIVGWLKHLH